MSLFELLAGRRSIRSFRPDAPDRATIERLLAAAVTAPSASNSQPWRWVVVAKRAAIERLAARVRDAVERIARAVPPASEPAFRAYGDYFTRFEGAPVVIVPLARPLAVLSSLVDERLSAVDRARIVRMEESSSLIAVSLALENLLLAAHEGGLGASVMTGPLVAADAIREVLDLPPSWEPVALVPLGFPAERPLATERKPLERLVRWIGEEEG